jgi:crotonobetainyl-CoA:carnitine CoA-transferase CaiB-like acyl-CoA transferase
VSTLDGTRVIDFGQYIAGPLAAVMLADQGAEVIHVDPPGGPRWKSDADAFYNRGKQRITLDLKYSQDNEIARKLLATADVVIENFRPGVMDRLALGAKGLTEHHPKLIYCSIPGFASDDPRRDVAAWEGVVGAATDTYATVGQLLGRDDPRVDDPDRPVYTALPLASNFGGFHAATAIVMALIARGRTGHGQTIEVPLFDAMFELIGANGISVDGEYRMTRSRGAGTYECQDGRRILFNSTSTPRFLRWFAQAAGISIDHPLGHDRLRTLFLTRPAREWEDLINTAGGPTTMVRSAAEWMASDQARQRRTVIQLDDPDLGPTWMPGVHVHMTDSPGSISPRHRVDADRANVLSALETSRGSVVVPSQDDTSVVEDDTSPLSGVKVLDLTQVVAGPCTGRILVEYGAAVIKINNPRPESLTAAVSLSGRPTDPGNQQHEHLNRGKQSLLLDLHTPGGLQVFSKLLDNTDVVMQNFAHGMAERYGIAYDQVRVRKPDVVYFSLSAYGYGGPMGTYRGFEGNAQAVTGLMHRFGGDGPPLGQPYLLDDYGTGIRGAFAIALGVFHRQRTGRGQHINIALAETATYHQAAFLVDHPGKVWNEARGIFSRGSGPMQRLYKASDGWFFLGTDSRQRLGSVKGLADVADVEDSALERLLEARFAENATDIWVARLRQAGVGAHAIARVEDLMQDPWVRDHGLSITQRIEGVGNMIMPGVAARLSRTPLRVGKPVHPAGADAAHILAQIGLLDELDQLVEEGAISTSLTQPSVLSPLSS